MKQSVTVTKTQELKLAGAAKAALSKFKIKWPKFDLKNFFR